LPHASLFILISILHKVDYSQQLYLYALDFMMLHYADYTVYPRVCCFQQHILAWDVIPRLRYRLPRVIDVSCFQQLSYHKLSME